MTKEIRTSRKRQCSAVVLLEVVLALVLFATAAAIIGAGLSTSIQSVERLRLNAHAANLAVSVLSELQMGTKGFGKSGPQQFEAPFEGWTWEAVPVADEQSAKETGLTRKVEVVIRHQESGIAHRLCQIIRLPEQEEKKTGFDFAQK